MRGGGGREPLTTQATQSMATGTSHNMTMSSMQITHADDLDTQNSEGVDEEYRK